MKDKKKCGDCELVYEVSEKRIVDVGTDFGPDFRYTCPKCNSANGVVLEE